MEYLCSQHSWEFRENFGRNPDSPDRLTDNLEEVEDEGFGEAEEDQDPTAHPLSLLSITKQQSSSQSHLDQPFAPQEVVCILCSICNSTTYRTVLFILVNIHGFRCAEDQTGLQGTIEW